MNRRNARNYAHSYEEPEEALHAPSKNPLQNPNTEEYYINVALNAERDHTLKIYINGIWNLFKRIFLDAIATFSAIPPHIVSASIQPEAQHIH